MQSAIDQFRVSIERVRDLIALHNSVKAQSTAALDLSDILRAALVLSVSALDYYIHEVVTLGMLEIYRGQRSEPNPSRNSSKSAFSRFNISLGGARQERQIASDISSWLENEIQEKEGYQFLEKSYLVSDLLPIISNSILNRLNNTAWLEDEIRENLGYKSFQQPDKIAEAIKLISDKKLWEEVATSMNKDAQYIKQQLTFIVDRRNKIAHEADIDPTYNLGNRWPINEFLVNDAVNFIEQIVERIHQVL
ncbi:HEPN domain-containing protein [Crocosphaera sp. UHCC 0190]|uniref:HEPN domain-containing protein n=1 Tax=Crocosphaera sp. UHCC 0190 TaxID=3110246 RepID=UPI002B20CC6B|nr:HEPN domain-containing protein [Crocosphaera sp. UHCC 0190]MEA5509792.1 HEPN domain-containing protein [Crocosphaera sp. UHCC 0190]